MKYTIFLFIILSACQSQPIDTPENISTETTKEEKTTAIETTADIPAPVEKQEKKIVEESTKGISNYNGEWFGIKYPSNFKAAPTEPTVTLTEDRFGEKFEEPYIFVRTEEAIFTSPDGKVEFFVYSPLWGGSPKSYLEATENEKIISDTTKKDKDPDWGGTHRWVSFEDKEGKYTRAFHQMTTENTSLVFGIKYTDQASYDKYKEDYLAFKKSLVQYAD